MAITQFDVEFTKSGETFDAMQVTALLGNVTSLSDLIVLAHGWNNDMAEAKQLYAELLGNIAAIVEANLVDGLAGRKFGALCAFWPSKKFADADIIPGGGAASATNENDAVLLKLLAELQRDPRRLGGTDTDPVRESVVRQLQQLVPRLEHDDKARREYVLLLRSIAGSQDAHVEDGTEEFFTADPQGLFDALANPVMAPAGPATGGAVAVGGGGAASLGDLLSGVKAAARRLANLTTYFAMKERAGLVGRIGLAQVLHRVRDRNPSIRLHLVGHSFGGRLVTAAGNALAPNTPAVSLSLLQAAFSHNGLAQDFDKEGHDGAFRSVLAERRVSGPIIITHTKNDRAVGIAYPLASRIARDQAAALGDEQDPYGGMGRNGAQFTPEAKGLAGNMLDVGQKYQFVAGKVYNLKADKFISDHGDVRGQQVAYAILNAARVI